MRLVGLRVVRGSDWKWGDQDGGEGCAGTVVECGPLNLKGEDIAEDLAHELCGLFRQEMNFLKLTSSALNLCDAPELWTLSGILESRKITGLDTAELTIYE